MAGKGTDALVEAKEHLLQYEIDFTCLLNQKNTYRKIRLISLEELQTFLGRLSLIIFRTLADIHLEYQIENVPRKGLENWPPTKRSFRFET